ncbi:MAG: two-component regulator propeller domain-containing protein, partial [Ginsengibacter sp.]
TEKFDKHPQAFLKSMGVPDDALLGLRKDAQGDFFFLGATSGLYKFSPSSGKTTHLADAGSDNTNGVAQNITDFAIDDNGFIWTINNTGLIRKINAKSGQLAFATNALQKQTLNTIHDFKLFEDSQGDLWIYSSGTPQGVFYYNASAEKLTHIKKDNNRNSLNNDVVRSVTQGEDGLIWIATDHGGINILDKKDFTIKYFLNSEDDNYSVAQNSINSMYKDNSGIVWIGTFKKGISYFNKSIIKFPLYRHKLTDPNSLSYNDVNRFVEDEKGNIWIGTNGGGLLYFDRKSDKFIKYQHNPSDKNSLSSDVIVSLCIDSKHTLWIGTYFGGLDHFDGNRFTHYVHDDKNPASISDNAIWSIMEDSDKRLWIGTFSSGLDRYERKTNSFTHFKATGYHSVHSKYVGDLLQAKNGDIWIATSNGVDVFDPKKDDFTHYFHHDTLATASSLSNDNTIALLQDSRGLVWIATRDGLNYYDPATGKFSTLGKQNGLADNIVLSIVEDKEHNIWSGTPNGLSNVIISKDAKSGKLLFQFRNYNQTDGLQGKEFNEYAAYCTRSGDIFFGGPNGFNLFNPEQINNSDFDPKLVLTDLQMFNKSVNVGEYFDRHVILPQSISVTKEITLKYNENIFAIEFAALNFFNISKLKYAYTLNGFNNEWFIADDKTHKATYTNLDPGTYLFKVRTINDDGTSGNDGTSLKIIILPPLWRTNYAYILYALLIIATTFISRKMILRRTRMRFAIEHERKEAQRIHALDLMKIKFFTNVSHELRTPLSLILTPLDKIINNASAPLQKQQFHVIRRNAQRLLQLVNQLLDFRKMEMREIRLEPTKGNIIAFIREISYSFNDLAAKNHIAFSFNCSIDTFYTEFDHDKIERILFNLLSNAFKFTHGDGEVSVEVNAAKEMGETTMIEIKVSDSGIGIAREKQEKIFERFFQNDIPENMVNQGSGIGLAITKEFVKLHNGSITVKSEVNVGSCFTLLLPFKVLEADDIGNIIGEQIDPDASYQEPSEIADEAAFNTDEILAKKNQKQKISQKQTILLVEDHEELRFYLKENLEQYFNIIEAGNGKDGWQKTLSGHPDIIVSDVSMPEMNGIDLCRKIKNDKRTSFIPVILLTALVGEDQELKGLKTGASDYMTKPFNFEILLSKINNILNQQESARKAYKKLVNANPSDLHVDSPDEKFMHRAIEVIEKNISNPNFSVEELSRELYISRVGLYKKMLALSGKSPLEFIKFIRLQRAMQLLEKSDLTISEIAYEVGFNDPKYFSKFFKASFNILPSAYQAKKKKEQENEQIISG